jgi:hypothetical protein
MSRKTQDFFRGNANELRQNVADDMRFFDAGEARVEATEGIREARIKDAEDVDHPGVEVAE